MHGRQIALFPHHVLDKGDLAFIHKKQKLARFTKINLCRQQSDGRQAIIAISGANRDQLLLAQDYGANAGLVKPLDRDEFLGILDRVLEDTRDSWTSAWIHPEFGTVGDR